MDVASALAPTNIAVVKYWGKDLKRGGNTPINSSASLTLDSEDLRAETVIVASAALLADELVLNGRAIATEGDSTHAKRLRTCLATMRALCVDPVPESSSARDAAELRSWKVRVVSRNTFPTAAGLASSAAGYAALVAACASLYGLKQSYAELSAIARRGSGSACRSLHGGLVAWRMGVAADCSDSKAEPLFDETYWPELRVVVLVASAAEKETPSTEGMQRSVETSPFLAHRAAAVAEPRLAELRVAFHSRNFEAFGVLCMRDSNSFHATCLDTYPPIFYLNETSKRAIAAVHAYNEHHGRVKVAYTFDAGPNAVVFCEDSVAADAFAALALRLFLPELSLEVTGGSGGSSAQLEKVCNRPQQLAAAANAYPPDAALLAKVSGTAPPLTLMYLTKVGGGALSPLAAHTVAELVDVATGEAVADANAALWQRTLS